MPAAGKRSQAAKSVHGQAAVEKYLTNWRMPERHHPGSRGFLCVQRNQAECVVGEMHRDVESDDDATDGTEPGESSRRDQPEGNLALKRPRKTES